MKIIESEKITNFLSLFLLLQGITIYPFIIMRPGAAKKYLIHEKIHIEQQKELFIIGFFIIYLIDFLYFFIKLRDFQGAYYNIRFEKEAYVNMFNDEYLKQRKRFAWKNF